MFSAGDATISSLHAQQYARQIIRAAEERKRYDLTQKAMIRLNASFISADTLRKLADEAEEALAPFGGDALGRLSRFAFLTLSELRDRPIPDPLIGGVLTTDGTSVVFGDSGAGKTTVILDMAACVSLGHSWHGHKVAQGPVWIIAAEGANALRFNLEAWARAHHIDDLPDLRIYPEPINLCEERDVLELLLAIDQAEVKPVWFVCDTLSATAIGHSDSDNMDMALYIDAMGRIRRACGGAQITTIHHLGHNGSLRGATAIQANVDAAIEIAGANMSGSIICRKQRGGWEPFKPEGYTLRQIALDEQYGDYTGVIAVEDNAPRVLPTVEKLSKNYATCLELLRERGGMTYGDWKRSAIEEGINEKTFERAPGALVRGGFVEKSVGGVYYPRTEENTASIPSPSPSATVVRVPSFSLPSPSLSLGSEGEGGNGEGSPNGEGTSPEKPEKKPTERPKLRLVSSVCPSRENGEPHVFERRNRGARVRLCMYCDAVEPNKALGSYQPEE